MIFTLSFAGFRRQLKMGVKIILLILILCYVLPKLFMLFLNFDSPRKPAGEQMPEKPLRVMLFNKNY